jgi:deoxycytidine triphosphate deaminase
MFLSDQELLKLDPEIVRGLDRSGDPYGANSKIQPASIDLTIGEIFLPEMSEGQKGSIEWPFHSYILGSGHTAILQTNEELDLPSDLAAIGFPPSRVSSKGLLMTNPGHVDPGYKGRMKFTVINMGRESFPLEKGDRIVTLLFFRLVPPAKKSFSERNPNFQGSVGHDELSKLATDFLDIESRAENKAKKYLAIGSAFTVGVPIIVAGIMVFGSINSAKNAADARMNEIEKTIIENKAALKREITDVNNKIGDLNLEKRIEELERLAKKDKPGSVKP